MLRKTIVTLVAIIAVIVMSFTGASARGWGGGGF
jgi:hypothetical protein